jgi:uncharacterized membrane protein
MSILRRLIEAICLTRKIHTRVPNEVVDLDVKVEELYGTYTIKEGTKRQVFSWFYKPYIQLPAFAFPIEVNSAVYTINGKVSKGRNFDKIVMRLKVNRFLMSFYWAAFLFMLFCTILLIQQAAAWYLIGLNIFMLLRIVLFFVSCNQELDKITNRITGFLMKSNLQPVSVYIKKRA